MGLTLGQEDPLEKGMATNSRLLPGYSQGQRSLGGYSPSGCTESDMSEHSRITTMTVLDCVRLYHH